MNKNHKDHIGQEFELGDWAAITQRNEVHVGKIVSISSKGAPTIARNSVEEFAIFSSDWRKNMKSWKTQEKASQVILDRFPFLDKKKSYIILTSWCRQKKFVVISPTEKMKMNYDINPNNVNV